MYINKIFSYNEYLAQKQSINRGRHLTSELATSQPKRHASLKLDVWLVFLMWSRPAIGRD